MIEKKLPEDCRLAFSGSFQENSCPFLKKKKKKVIKKKIFFLWDRRAIFIHRYLLLEENLLNVGHWVKDCDIFSSKG